VVAEVRRSLWGDSLTREGGEPDRHDGYAVASWMRRADLDGSLAAFLDPCLTPEERVVARIEGWILGVA
jgi:hypothetical protein